MLPVPSAALLGDDPAEPVHMDSVTLHLVPAPHLIVPSADCDEATINEWVTCIRPLYLVLPADRHRAELAIDGAAHLLRAHVDRGTIEDMSARWLLLGMVTQADFAGSASRAWLSTHRFGHGSGDVEELSDLVRDELSKTIMNTDGASGTTWIWERIASVCGWARKIATIAAQQRKDKLGERNKVGLYGSSDEDRSAVYGDDPHAVVSMNPEGREYDDFRDNPAGALHLRQNLEREQAAGGLVARFIGVPHAPRITSDLRIPASKALVYASAGEVRMALKMAAEHSDRPTQAIPGQLYDMWSAVPRQAQQALLAAGNPLMCLAWARGYVGLRPRYSASIVNAVAARLKAIRPMRRWVTISAELAHAYAESVSDLPNELSRSAFSAASEKSDAQLAVDLENLLALAAEAIQMWDEGVCPLGDTPAEVADTLRVFFTQVLDDLADQRARDVG